MTCADVFRPAAKPYALLYDVRRYLYHGGRAACCVGGAGRYPSAFQLRSPHWANAGGAAYRGLEAAGAGSHRAVLISSVRLSAARVVGLRIGTPLSPSRASSPKTRPEPPQSGRRATP